MVVWKFELRFKPYFSRKERTNTTLLFLPFSLLLLFSAPEPKAQVHYCHHALCVRRPTLTFHIFDFFSETAGTEFNETWQEARSSTKFVCFWADRKNKMAALASDWFRHFRLLLWNRWTEFNETWQKARSQRLLPSLCFSDRWVTEISALADLSKRLYSGAWYVALWASCFFFVCQNFSESWTPAPPPPPWRKFLDPRLF